MVESLVIFAVALVGLDLLAARYGVDTSDGADWASTPVGGPRGSR